MTTICGVCEREWPTDTGRQVCPSCGNNGEIEGHIVRDDDPIQEFAQALDRAPKVAEAPFALTAEVQHSGGRQSSLF